MRVRIMKPCRYCSEPEEIELVSSWGDVYVRCNRCRAEGPHLDERKQVLAIQAWNGECKVIKRNPRMKDIYKGGTG